MAHAGYTLADVIQALKHDLDRARELAGETPRFKYQRVDLKLAVTTSVQTGGGLSLTVLGTGGSGARENIETSAIEISISLDVLDEYAQVKPPVAASPAHGHGPTS